MKTGRELIVTTALLLALLAPAPARATVGGPTLLDVLGWDPGTRRVYVHFLPMDGADLFGDVVSYPLEGAGPGGEVRESWVRQAEGTSDDPQLRAKLKSLRKRLKPLVAEPAAALPWKSSIAGCDSMPDRGSGVALRYRVCARWESEPEFEFTTWESPLVALKAVYGFPGRGERLFVFAFTGTPFEGGYETQVPVLVKPGEKDVRKVVWVAEAP